MPLLDHVPTTNDVDRIASVNDPVIRNLQITLCYHELAMVMQRRTGVVANWCTFATWASKQAGQTIRKQDLARMLENIAFTAQAEEQIILSAQSAGSQHSPAEIRGIITAKLNPLTALERAADAVGRGNKKVYEEIGREFARFYAACLPDTTHDARNISRFCDGLRPGDPPDGQQYLRQAFARYYQALFETDARTRAELILLANIEIGYHEQTRLQPEIVEAMSAAFADRQGRRLRVLMAIFPFRVWARMFVLRLFGRRSGFEETLDALMAELRRQAHIIVTKYMMMLELPPGRRLHLGQDVPGQFPPSLQQIAHPDLRALLDKIDLTRETTAASGASNWAQLSERLHFIADLFRCYQEDADLSEAPFTAAQVAEIKAGRLPEGRL